MSLSFLSLPGRSRDGRRRDEGQFWAAVPESGTGGSRESARRWKSGRTAPTDGDCRNCLPSAEVPARPVCSLTPATGSGSGELLSAQPAPAALLSCENRAGSGRCASASLVLLCSLINIYKYRKVVTPFYGSRESEVWWFLRAAWELMKTKQVPGTKILNWSTLVTTSRFP